MTNTRAKQLVLCGAMFMAGCAMIGSGDGLAGMVRGAGIGIVVVAIITAVILVALDA